MRVKRPRALGVIPARMGSTRFPGKPLALLRGMPMIWHVWKRSILARSLDAVVIATCDEDIRRAAESFGAKVVMTSSKHTRANDRVAEACARIPCDVVLNIQGDEPLVDPRLIDDVVAVFRRKPSTQCVNPVSEMDDAAEIASRNTVKVVFDKTRRALYFSRLPIPSDMISRRSVPIYRQVPVLAFRKPWFLRLSKLPETPLEIQESVDMMRAVENGMPVEIIVTKFKTIGVDTPEDAAQVERLLETDPVYLRCAREGRAS